MSTIGRSTASQIHRNRSQRATERHNTVETNQQHKESLSNVGVPLQPTGWFNHVASYIPKNALKQYGSGVEKLGNKLSWNRSLLMGIGTLGLMGLVGGGYLGWSQAANIAGLANSVFNTKFDPSNTATKMATTAAAGIVGGATGQIAKALTVPRLEKQRTTLVDQIKNTVEEVIETRGEPERTNQEILTEIGSKKASSLSEAKNDFKAMNQIINENQEMRAAHEGMGNIHDSQAIGHDLAKVVNEIQVIVAGDTLTADQKRATITNIQNPAIRQVILNSSETNKQKLVNEVLDAFPTNILSIARKPRQNWLGQNLSLEQYKDQMLSRTNDPETQLLIRNAISEPNATIDSVRNKILATKPEGVIAIAQEAEIEANERFAGAGAENTILRAQYVRDAVIRNIKEPNIVRVAQDAANADGTSEAVVRLAVENAVTHVHNNAHRSETPFSKDMTELPVGVLSPQKLEEVQALGGLFLSNNAHPNSGEIGYKLAALKNYGIDVKLDDIDLNGDAIALAANNAADGGNALTVRDAILRNVRNPEIRQAAEDAALADGANANSVRLAVFRAIRAKYPTTQLAKNDVVDNNKIVEMSNNINRLLTIKYRHELDSAISLLWAESKEGNMVLNPVLKKFENIVKHQYLQSKDLGKLEDKMKELIEDHYENDDLIRPVLEASLDRFINKKKKQIKAKEERTRQRQLKLGDDLDNIITQSLHKKKLQKAKKTKAILTKMAKGEQLSGKEVRRARKAAEYFSQHSDKKMIIKRDFWKSVRTGKQVFDVKERRRVVASDNIRDTITPLLHIPLVGHIWQKKFELKDKHNKVDSFKRTQEYMMQEFA